MPHLLDEMVAARLPWTSPTVASWCSEADLRRRVRHGLATEADRVGSRTFGEQLRDQIGLPGSGDPLAWANRRLALPDGGWVVTGIRFRGRDVTRPFVDVIATTAPPSPDGLAEIAEVVVPAYDAFSPLCLRVEAPDTSTLVPLLEGDPRFGPGCAVDLLLVAGLVEELRAQRRVPTYGRTELRPGDPAPLARRVAAIYDELTREAPALVEWAVPEDEDDLAECAEAGLLFEIVVDGRPAGVIGAVRADAHAVAGFGVREICLDAAHRGRRLAPAAEQRLVDALPARDGEALWGSIHPANTPSLRNARSIGRDVVSAYLWVTPWGLPGMAPTG